MIRRILPAVAVSAVLLCGCGDKARQTAAPSDRDSLETETPARSTVFGMCGDGSAMNTLQLIADSGDTLTLSVAAAKENGRLLGGYASGDRMAVVVSAGKDEAEMVINETTLLGNWVMLNPLDGSSVVGISLRDGGVAESIDQSTIVYRTWRIVDGQLEILSMREGGGDMEETNVYDIMKLDGDSLIYGNDEDLFEYERQR